MREKEFQERPKAFDELGSMIVRFEKIVTQYESGVSSTSPKKEEKRITLDWLPPHKDDEQYSHIEATEMAKVKEQIQVKRSWLNAQMQAVHAAAKYCDPPVKCVQIQAETKVGVAAPASLGHVMLM